ncbi:molybdopterin cofactor-binding domain-containing protein [Paraburkholderia sp. BCC1876]|uniref:xanthine dehydrogenase family protein molybdopterin-binding subunit n=1 Tax=Paraburkholderia sp. BCC1876 TaxID=2676303 RepID=UPI00158FC773|nr:molybdopterin cofactor-binding domain-containing protein [Paraburkholderia sp. BCC1876]
MSESVTELLVERHANRTSIPATPEATPERTPYLGRSMERLEDAAILTGRGRYGDDIAVKPGTLHAAVLRSPHPHAEINGIDVSAALTQKGVHAVLTGEDIRQWSQPFVVGVKSAMEHWSLAIDRVRYSGEPVAVVIAESRAMAEDGIERIKVDYTPLAPVTSIQAAMADDAPILHPKVGTNIVSDRNFRYGEPEEAFAKAPHRVSIEAHYPRNTCTPIECAVVIAEHLQGDEGYEVTSNFMGPFSLHAVMSMALKVPANRLRHKAPRDSGGSFGVKQAVFPYVVLMCLASRKAGAPVKWVEDRLEHLTAATSATARWSTIDAAVESDGRITALSYDQIEDCGGYLRAPEPATFYRMHGCLTGAYAIPNLLVRNRVALTTKTPTGLVRGFGGPQVYFALERLVQRIAIELQLDVLDVYRRNFVASNAFPYRTPAGALLDSGNYQEALRRSLSEGGYDELVKRRELARSEGRLYGIGFAAIVEPSVSNMGYISTVLPVEARRKAGPKSGAIASATVSVDLLGGVVVTVASTPAGQGHMTVCAQVVADALGLNPADIVVNVEFDTHKDAWSIASGNYSSRFAGAVAGTVHLAAMRVKDKLSRILSAQFGCEPEDIAFEDGRIFSKQQPEKALPFNRVASNAAHWAPSLLPEGEEPGLRETVFWTPPNMEPPDAEDRINTSACYGFAFDMCGIEIDPATGRIRIDRYVTTHDAGKLLNPALADGQIRGAFAQGLGAALYEEFRYGADGSFQSGTLADYLMPTTCEVPDPIIIHLETPSPFTPLGAKGLGEGNNMSTPPCVANAVADALGVQDIRLPLTPAKVMEMIGIDEPEPSRPEYRGATPKKKQAGAGKALTAQGSVEIEATPEAVFAVLMDPAALAKVVPGCNALETIGENQYRADVTVGVGMIKARFEAKIGLSDIEAPKRLRLAGAGLSSLGSAQGEGLVELTPTAKGTLLSYDYEAQVSGKVAAVGGRMLEGAAKVVLSQLFESLGRQASGMPIKGSNSWFKKIAGWFRRSS